MCVCVCVCVCVCIYYNSGRNLFLWSSITGWYQDISINLTFLHYTLKNIKKYLKSEMKNKLIIEYVYSLYVRIAFFIHL